MAKNSSKKGSKIKKWLSSPGKILLWEVFLFSLTLGLGILSSFKISQSSEIQKMVLSRISFWQFLLYFFTATLFILLITFLKRFEKLKELIFKGLFISVVTLGGLIILRTWTANIWVLGLIVVLIFWWFKKPTVLIHNLAIILGIAGTISVLGMSLEPLTVVSFLILFSIYDFIAVYKTKHMVRMAKEMIKSRAILAFIIPSAIADLKISLKKTNIEKELMILGGGDVAFPLLLCSSLIHQGVTDALIVAAFSLLGLLLGFYFFTSQRIRRPIPALPPIALFSIIGYLVILII